jgi:hypothetical protein
MNDHEKVMVRVGDREAEIDVDIAPLIQQWANIGGTKGFVYVPDFVLPHYGAEVGFEVSNPVFYVAGCDFNMEDHRRRVAVREYGNSAPNSQEANMFRKFAALALSGKPDESWGAMVLKTQQVLDACLQSAASEGRMFPVFEALGKEPVSNIEER